MRMEQLHCLVEISRCKSLNLASEKVHMTQQALSSSMRNLENELGVQLLHRSRKGCTFTDEGKQLLELAEDFLPRFRALCEKFKNSTASAGSTFEGSLHIYVNSVFYLALLSNVINRFCERHPKLKVVILAHSPAHICEKLEAAPSDGIHRVGFVNVPCMMDGTPDKTFFTPTPGVCFHPLAKGSYVACVGTDSPLSAQNEVSITTLLKYPLVIGASDDTDATPLHKLLSAYGTPHIALSVASMQLWNQAVASNVGVGFLHDIFLEDASYMRHHVQNTALIPIREKLPAVTGYLVTATPGPVVEGLIGCLPQPLLHGNRGLKTEEPALDPAGLMAKAAPNSQSSSNSSSF